MLAPFFVAAMRAPGRHAAFRGAAVAHALLVAGLCGRQLVCDYEAAATANYLLLVLGLVEGAALVGWRLTQMPKSQALEFLLTSPIQPRRLFLAEALVGIGRFLLVWLAGLPMLVGLAVVGAVEFADLWPLAGLPALCGVAAGLALTAWVYEPVAVRRVGELLSLAGVLLYLVIGVLAGENLRLWLEQLPESVGRAGFAAVMFLHEMNPFGVVRYWFDPWRADDVAVGRLRFIAAVVAAVGLVAGVRAAFRLRGHFHDRHYKPLSSSRPSQLEAIGDRPLSWWAVRRVMEYSGRVNLWLAGGFCLMYAAFLVAGDAWPSWLGKLVFQLFDLWGGPPTVATAMVVMAAVPAVFQFGLWDQSTQARCMRLELLLLTELQPADYWHASLSAAWARGRGYLFSAAVLWLALGVGGRNTWAEVAAAATGAAVFWAFAFAVGFRSFMTGSTSNGLASFLTLGMPMVLWFLLRADQPELAGLVPTAACYLPLRAGATPWWAAGVLLLGGVTLRLARTHLATGDASLRAWYSASA